jgi:hypothetical protein
MNPLPRALIIHDALSRLAWRAGPCRDHADAWARLALATPAPASGWTLASALVAYEHVAQIGSPAKPLPLRLAAYLSALLHVEGLVFTHARAKVELASALSGVPIKDWTLEVVADTYLHLRERMDAEMARGERIHGQHPAQEP